MFWNEDHAWQLISGEVTVNKAEGETQDNREAGGRDEYEREEKWTEREKRRKRDAVRKTDRRERGMAERARHGELQDGSVVQERIYF